ncbi:MAG TPA: amino acid deaminase/aldolase [Solirubrobacteraceae bacterium]|jgi:D-serine deaminase-like pyridoxal phosphate-dependent protein
MAERLTERGPRGASAERADSADSTERARREREHARLERATDALDAPFALIDLDALRANAGDLERRAAGLPIRLASKSLRCRALQQLVLERAGFHGTLAFTLPEALWLASHGVDDILVAYPTADASALRELAERSPAAAERITVIVDSVEQLDWIDRVLAGTDAGAGAGGRGSGGSGDAGGRGELRVCIDVDAGWRALGGRVRVGVKRSPAHTPADAAELARAIVSHGRLRLVGVMMYEAQIAGVGDRPPGRTLRAVAIRAMQALSARELLVRRRAVVDAVQGVLAAAGRPPLELVNGGGSGDVELCARDRALTEVTAGSGLYGPTLFDAYRSFTPRPAALFALPVVRRPGAGVATALGGGYLASGPADAARLPRPYLPRGLRLDRQEGAGEVQTPLLGPAADELAIGDRVYMRHAKAGELCERFASVHVLDGDEIVDELPTYRGEGQCFL